jgi:hypothetical protein
MAHARADNRYTRGLAEFVSGLRFMHRVGLLKVTPESGKDVFTSELHALPGN